VVLLMVGWDFRRDAAWNVNFFLKVLVPLGPFYDLDEITKTIATLPGGYSLFFLDGQTCDTYRQGLAADSEFALDRYPSWDKIDPNASIPMPSPANNPRPSALGRAVGRPSRRDAITCA
jgi:hypothetical protein